MTWVARVSYRDPDGRRQQVVEIYDQDKKPDHTRVIRDLVPRDCTTTSISIKKK